MSEAKRYTINGKTYSDVSGDHLIDLAKTHLAIDGELNVKREEERTMGDLLYDIQDCAWQATAFLSGIGAILENSPDGDVLAGEHTFEHITWLHIAAKQKIEAMQDVIEEYESRETAENRAKRDSRESNQVVGT